MELNKIRDNIRDVVVQKEIIKLKLDLKTKCNEERHKNIMEEIKALKEAGIKSFKR